MNESKGDTLVIGVASSALFDLTESHAVFLEQGEDKYRKYQEEHYDTPLTPGVAFPFIRRILELNGMRVGGPPLVEAIILSRNDPDTGSRVMNSVEHHGLPISRAVFMQGHSPYKFIPAFGMKLFLSANIDDVRAATALGYPSGQVLGSASTMAIDDPDDFGLRIAFDFDSVLGGDSSEQVYDSEGIDRYRMHEIENALTPLEPGPMKSLLAAINRIQDIEDSLANDDPSYNRKLFVSIVTARNAPAHARPIRTLKAWGLRVNDAFFLGGWPKGPVLETLRPHIFFDDQIANLEGSQNMIPSVHVPFGIKNAKTS